MKITKLETLRLKERPNLLWVLVHTNEGLVGLGETFFIAETVETYLHEYVAPRVIGRLSTARDKAARAQIELFGTALDSYRLDNGVYPTTQQGLEALWAQPTTAPAPRNWTGPYLRKRVPADPWGNPYVYRSPGEANPDSYDLVSLGRDGAPGGEGEDADIRSWE